MERREAKRAVKRSINAILLVAALAVIAAVIIDMASLGPRKASSASGATLVTSPPTQPLPLGQAVTPVSTIARSPRACRATRVQVFGGSLVAGNASFRGPLSVTLHQRVIPIDLWGSQTSDPTGGGDGDHEGYAGATLDQLTTLAGTVFEQHDSDVVLVLAGLDDIASPTRAQAAPTALTALIERIAKATPTALIVVLDVPKSSDPAIEQHRIAVNAAAKRAGDASKTDQVFFASVSEKLTQLKWDPATDISEDGVSFTVAGGRTFAVAIEPVVAGAIVRDRTRRCVPPQRTTTLPTVDFGDDHATVDFGSDDPGSSPIVEFG